MDRQQERLRRAAQEPIVGSLPEVPGISVAMRLTPGLGLHLRGLADELLVNPYPGASLTRAERELIAMSVSAGNDCYFCMDSHGAFASVLLRDGGEQAPEVLVERIKGGTRDDLDEKMRALLAIADTVRRDALRLTAQDVQRALDAGASDADVQLAVLIAAGSPCTTGWSTGSAHGRQARWMPSSPARRRSHATGTARRRPSRRPARCRRARLPRPRRLPRLRRLARLVT